MLSTIARVLTARVLGNLAMLLLHSIGFTSWPFEEKKFQDYDFTRWFMDCFMYICLCLIHSHLVDFDNDLWYYWIVMTLLLSSYSGLNADFRKVFWNI